MEIESASVDDVSTIRGLVWRVLEKPESSLVATCFTLFSLLAITISIVATIAETSYKIQSDKLSDNFWMQLGE